MLAQAGQTTDFHYEATVLALAVGRHSRYYCDAGTLLVVLPVCCQCAASIAGPPLKTFKSPFLFCCLECFTKPRQMKACHESTVLHDRSATKFSVSVGCSCVTLWHFEEAVACSVAVKSRQHEASGNAYGSPDINPEGTRQMGEEIQIWGECLQKETLNKHGSDWTGSEQRSVESCCGRGDELLGSSRGVGQRLTVSQKGNSS